ncbi:MAG: formylglycine-generating enzyme family protein [Paludibacteraceae bacterium]|nr:formylglycine-generating enzyme family protein [Paludibacteraceae bacterium]
MIKKHFYAASFAVIISSCAGTTSTENNTKEAQPVTEANPVEKDSFSLKGTTYYMVKVEGGEFEMGATEKEKEVADKDEHPLHKVKINSFYIGQLEVTQKLWQDVMGENPSSHKGDLFPVENVSWNKCQEFLEKLNAATGQTFRLPTEAEWEYAAKGGKYTHNYLYAGSDDIEDVAWYNKNRGEGTHIVGTKNPNELNLYDMSGNVAEWCSDWYNESYYEQSGTDNPKGPEKGDYHVLRGGGWYITNKSYIRSSNRSGNTPGYTFNYLGLRLAKDEK